MSHERIFNTRDGRKFTIRLAAPADYDAGIESFRQVASEKIYLNTEVPRPNIKETWTERWVRNGEKTLFAVAEVQGQIVGGVVLTDFSSSPKHDHVRDLGMWIVSEHRENGIGKALMEYAIQWAKDNGSIKKIVLGVWSTNTRALNLYLKSGFHVEGSHVRGAKINGNYVDEILMSLDMF